MATRLYPVLEHAVDGLKANEDFGQALAKVVEVHPALSPLLDFYSADPQEIAVAVGMISPHEEDGMDDLEAIDFGPGEWYEPSAGLAAIRAALRTLQADPQSISGAVYDPALRPEDVMADLEAMEQMLQTALQHETRFHFALDA